MVHPCVPLVRRCTTCNKLGHPKIKKFLAVGEALMAIFWPAACIKGRTCCSSGFSTEGTLISVSAVPHCREMDSSISVPGPCLKLKRHQQQSWASLESSLSMQKTSRLPNWSWWHPHCQGLMSHSTTLSTAANCKCWNVHSLQWRPTCDS